MGLLALLRKLKTTDEEARILILGLDAAGKTTILTVLSNSGTKKADIEGIVTTKGFNIKQLQNDGFKLNVWDIGGQKNIRTYWRNYVPNTDILIWVVDSADAGRFDESATELGNIVDDEHLKECPVLIFSNKSDLLSSRDKEEVAAKMKPKLGGRTFTVQQCSAKDDDCEGLQKGMEWCINQLSLKAKAKKKGNSTRSGK